MQSIAHKIRLNPTAEQEEFFRRSVGTVRFAWNWARDEYLNAIKDGRKPEPALTLKKRFNALKGVDFPWTYEVSKSCTEYGFARFGRALNNYYSSKKGERKGERMGFPKLKSRRNSRQSFYVANDGVKHDGHWFKIPRLDTPVNMAEPLRFCGKINSVVVSTEGDGRWYASFSMEIDDLECDTTGLPIVGVDLGSRALTTVYDGRGFTQYDPGDFQKRELRKLRRLNRRLARRVKDSNGWKEAKKDLNRLHSEIKSQRMDYIHKMTTEIVMGASVVIIEDLHVKGMMRNRRVARTIADAAMGEIKRQLIYKCELYGRLLIKIDRFFPSSKTCSACTAVNAELGSSKTWTCCSCGTHHDRDENAAVNIRCEGMKQL